MQITKYFASLGFDIDKASVKKVDNAINHVENKLKKLGTFANKPIVLNIGNFSVDQKKMNLALGNALDMASNRLVFEVNQFSVNQTALNRDVANAMMRASNANPLRVNPRVSGVVEPRGISSRTSGAIGGGLIGRGISGLYGPALALGLGGYGLGALNRRNQEVVSAQLQTSAVVQQAGGTAAQGAESFQYLRGEGQRIGFNFLDASGDYNKLISGLTGSGVGLKESQKVFSGFAELARVNKLDKTTQNRLFRALSQVAGKGKLQSEELTGQIAEALPGGTALFAQAYQDKIGGNKTGSEAIQQLLADMKDGKVTSDILTFAGARASAQANKGGALGTASQASQAEQARYQNTVNDLAVVASNSGVEEGFARIFRTLNAGLSESGSLVRGLSEGFNEATKWADDLLLFPQSFVRALEGKDSLVADWLGVDKTEQLRKDWTDIKQIFTDIGSIKFDFLPTLEATAREIAGIMNAVTALKQWNDNASAAADIVQADSASRGDGPISSGLASLWGSIAGLSAYVSTPFSVDESNQYKDYVMNEYSRGAQVMKDQEQLQGISQNLRLQSFDPVSASQSDVTGYSDALAGEFRGMSDASKQSALEKSSEVTNNNSQANQIDVIVNVDGSTLNGMDAEAQAAAIGQAVANQIAISFEQVNVNFPTKE